jgi:hypothetical protein
VILPTKHLPLDKSALGSAAILLLRLTGAPTVSELWERVAVFDDTATFDQFVMALDLLFIVGVVAHRDGRVVMT